MEAMVARLKAAIFTSCQPCVVTIIQEKTAAPGLQEVARYRVSRGMPRLQCLGSALSSPQHLSSSPGLHRRKS